MPALHPPSASRGARLPWELDDPDEPTPWLTAADATDRDANPPHEGVAEPFGEFVDPAADPAGLPTEEPGTFTGPGSPPGSRPSRFRVGVGAALVLVIVALVSAVLVSMFAPRGRTDLVAPGLSAPVAPSSTSAAGAGESGSSPPSSGGALPPSSSSPAPPGSGATPGASPTGGLILLHVLGAVAHPGLYELHAGDRVVDAVAAAGGFTPNADQTQQNLARPIADGEQLIIPEQGAAPPLGSAAAGTAGLTPGAGAGAAGAAAAGSGSAVGSPGGGQPPALVNINTADQALLETLPQVGPALAQRIIAWRTTNGRFTQLDDLKNVTGIGDKTFAALQPLVTL